MKKPPSLLTRRVKSPVAGILPAVLLFAWSSAQAANITWIGGSADWVEGNGNNANWNPADEPDSNDAAVFNTANVVSMGSNNTVNGLTLSASMDLFTNSFNLTVDGLVQLTGDSTNLIVGGVDSLLLADSLTINSQATVDISGGNLTVQEETGSGLFYINADGLLDGHGVVGMNDALAAVTTLIVNDGTINPRRSPAIILGPPIAGTLQFNATDTDARIDLDGTGGEDGAVIVGRNQTLDLNIRLSDIFNGSISMVQGTMLDVSDSWILGAGATLDVDNGALGGFPAVAAGVATIAGASFSQNSGTISVVDNDGTLQFDAPFSLNGGTLANNGLVVFNSSTTIAAAANFTMPTTTSSITVAANRTVNINQINFNLDGSNAATNAITVNDDGTLNVNTTDYDPDSATNAFDGTVNLNNGTININTADAEFVMDGVLNANATGSNQSLWTGEPLAIGNDAGVLDADVKVTGTQPTQFGSAVRFLSDADVDVADGTTMHFLAVANFNTVNGGNNARFTGSGEMIFSGPANFTEATHLNMVGGTVDLDGADSIGDLINVDSPLTIHAALMRSFGKANGGGGTNLIDVNNSVATGVLTVVLDNAADEWTLNSQGTLQLVNDNTEATLLAGSDLNVNGTMTVVGDVRTTARLDIGSTATININTAGQPLRLAGGSGADFNTISGGTITGVGSIGADTGKELRGFGTINADIEFAGSANLRATGGTLTLGGDFVSVNILGTADATGVLNVSNPWFSEGGPSGVIGAVVLNGGTLQGAQVTNDNSAGIQGHGTITARVTNSSQIIATNGGTMLLQTAGNDNDWDGTGIGHLEALSANLELRDVGAAFGFTGTVRAINNQQVFANGFALDFNPGSTLTLDETASYRSTASTDIGGAVNILPGATPTIQVSNNSFLTFESSSVTSLNGNLTLLNNNIIIEAGATFTGTGALVIPNGSHVVMEPLSNANVLLDLAGALRPANSEGIGQVTVKDFQESASSELFMEVTGAALNQYDRITVNGIAVVDGLLFVDIDGVFVPTLGQTFNILSASGGVTGKFDAIQSSGMPNGLVFKINYLPTIVQVEVISGFSFEEWINLYPSLAPGDRVRTADPDHDGLNNLMEFAFDGDPTSGASTGKVVTKIAPVGGENALTLTFPVRFLNAANDTPGPEFRLVGFTDPILQYRVFASDDFVTNLLDVNLVIGADATAIQAGLPPLNSGWSYATCRSAGPVAGDAVEFMRVGLSEGPLSP